MKRLVVFAFIALTVLVVGIGSFLAWNIRQPYRGYSGPEQFVEIPPGASSRDIGARLVEAGVIRDPVAYRVAIYVTHQGRNLKAGEYRFDRPMTAFDVVEKIARGDVFMLPLTIPEGLTMAEMAKIFESRGYGKAPAFAAAAKNVALVSAIDRAAPDLEGYLFPETYALPRHTDAATVVRLMVERFLKVLTPELRDAAAARGLSIRELVTLASIVEKETAHADERPLVAAVYQNRLRIRMPLQCDPTVIYGLERAGQYTGNLRREDLASDSPYNTYRVAGLPPGPIASPGKASLEAAAHPADVDYLYFVSRNDGSHAFARTLDEHNRNVHKYQVEYFRAQRR